MTPHDVLYVLDATGAIVAVQIPLAEYERLLAQSIELEQWKADIAEAEGAEVAAVARVMDEAARAWDNEQHQSVKTA